AIGSPFAVASVAVGYHWGCEMRGPERSSDHCARASRQIVLELLAEVPIAASLGGILQRLQGADAVVHEGKCHLPLQHQQSSFDPRRSPLLQLHAARARGPFLAR